MSEFSKRYDEGLIKEGLPPSYQEFREITRCVECGGEVEQKFSGDEGWGFCNDCGIIEGDTITVFECSLCLEEQDETKNEPECNCYG